MRVKLLSSKCKTIIGKIAEIDQPITKALMERGYKQIIPLAIHKDIVSMAVIYESSIPLRSEGFEN